MELVTSALSAIWTWVAANREGLVAIAALLSPVVAAIALYSAPKVQLAIARLQYEHQMATLEVQKRKNRADILTAAASKEIDALQTAATEFLNANWRLYLSHHSTTDEMREKIPKVLEEFNKIALERNNARIRLLIKLDVNIEIERKCRDALRIHGLDLNVPDQNSTENLQIQLIGDVIRSRQQAAVSSVL